MGGNQEDSEYNDKFGPSYTIGRVTFGPTNGDPSKMIHSEFDLENMRKPDPVYPAPAASSQRQAQRLPPWKQKILDQLNAMLAELKQMREEIEKGG